MLSIPANVVPYVMVVSDTGSVATQIETFYEGDSTGVLAKKRLQTQIKRADGRSPVQKLPPLPADPVGFSDAWFSPDGTMSDLPIYGTSTYSSPIISYVGADGTIAGEVCNINSGYSGVNLPTVWLPNTSAPVLLCTPGNVLGNVTSMTSTGVCCGNYYAFNAKLSSGIIWPQGAKRPGQFIDLNAVAPLPNGAVYTNVYGVDSASQTFMAEVQASNGMVTYESFPLPSSAPIRRSKH
jgi:hypothetical protein